MATSLYKFKEKEVEKLKLSHVKKIEQYIVHCSDSDDPRDDHVGAIKKLHTSPREVLLRYGHKFNYKTNKFVLDVNGNKVERHLHGKAWLDVGYEFFISKKWGIQRGRALHLIGAHTRGYNSKSIGICLSGSKEFTDQQLAQLEYLITSLIYQFGNHRVKPHNFYDKTKSCPNFKIERFKQYVP